MTSVGPAAPLDEPIRASAAESALSSSTGLMDILECFGFSGRADQDAGRRLGAYPPVSRVPAATVECAHDSLRPSARRSPPRRRQRLRHRPSAGRDDQPGADHHDVDVDHLDHPAEGRRRRTTRPATSTTVTTKAKPKRPGVDPRRPSRTEGRAAGRSRSAHDRGRAAHRAADGHRAGEAAGPRGEDRQRPEGPAPDRPQPGRRGLRGGGGGRHHPLRRPVPLRAGRIRWGRCGRPAPPTSG